MDAQVNTLKLSNLNVGDKFHPEKIGNEPLTVVDRLSPNGYQFVVCSDRDGDKYDVPRSIEVFLYQEKGN